MGLPSKLGDSHVFDAVISESVALFVNDKPKAISRKPISAIFVGHRGYLKEWSCSADYD